MGGADFGGGVWDLLASGPRRDEQRKLIADSLAPIWEANHVWLIVVVVVLFTAFPAAFRGDRDRAAHSAHDHARSASCCAARRSCFAPTARGRRPARERWGATFAVASVITPIVLGISIGALASGDVGAAARRASKRARCRSATASSRRGSACFPSRRVCSRSRSSRFSPRSISRTARTTDELRETFRRRALAAAAAVFVLRVDRARRELSRSAAHRARRRRLGVGRCRCMC